MHCGTMNFIGRVYCKLMLWCHRCFMCAIILCERWEVPGSLKMTYKEFTIKLSDEEIDKELK